MEIFVLIGVRAHDGCGAPEAVLVCERPVPPQDILEIHRLLEAESGEPLCQVLEGCAHILAEFPLCLPDQAPEGGLVHFSHSSIPPILIFVSSPRT